MKGLKVLSFLVAVLAVGSIGYYIINYIIECNKAERGSVAERIKEDLANESDTVIQGTVNELTKTNSEGGVAIKTTLLSEKSSTDQLVFEVVMNTHSIDLTQYDLAKLAFLTFGLPLKQSRNV